MKSTELQVVRAALSLEDQGATITPTALIIDPKATDKQLGQIRGLLAQIEGGRSWWIGDYGVAIQSRKGAHYTEGLAESLGVQRNTLKQYKSVAAFFKPSSRLDGLSFQHHYEAMAGANGNKAKAQKWLQIAVSSQWSVSQLRKAIRLARAENKPDELERTGNGHSALSNACQWVSRQIEDASTYEPEQAAAILSDVKPLIEFIEILRERAKHRR